MNATYDNVLQIQKVNDSLIYNVLELTFNPLNNTRILKLNDVDIVEYLNHSVSSNVYSKTDKDIGLNLKADKHNTCVQSDDHVFLGILHAGIDRKVGINVLDPTRANCWISAQH